MNEYLVNISYSWLSNRAVGGVIEGRMLSGGSSGPGGDTCGVSVGGVCDSVQDSCAAGIYRNLSTGWSCDGLRGGRNVICSVVDGVCGVGFENCQAGAFRDILDNVSHYLWSCKGLSGGLDANNCSLNRSTLTSSDPDCILVDGGWSGYSNLCYPTQSGAECGNGYKYRACTNPAPRCGGADCFGSDRISCVKSCSNSKTCQYGWCVSVTIYVLDDTNDRIARYSSWADTSPSYKPIGSGSWQGLAVDGSNIYVVDYDDRFSWPAVIKRYTSWSDTSPDSKNVATYGNGISVKSGTIYVLSNSFDRIARYSSWADTSPDYKMLGDGGWDDFAITGSTIYVMKYYGGSHRIYRETWTGKDRTLSKRLDHLGEEDAIWARGNEIYLLTKGSSTWENYIIKTYWSGSPSNYKQLPIANWRDLEIVISP